MKFSIIIPNYNSEKHIIKLLDSINSQTCRDFEVIIVDDMSTDKSCDLIKKYREEKMTLSLLELTEKRYNGGTRNEGVTWATGDYILFADCDDWLYSNTCLEDLSKVIDKNQGVDLVRLSYAPHVKGLTGKLNLHEKDLKELCNTVFVAPWTKCVRRDLFVPFPENTLVEDVVQHIAQIDKISRFTYCDTPIIVWNRDNQDAISADTRVYDRDSKRYSSLYRNIADLLDLRCKHDYCETRRQERINWYLDKVHHGEEGTIVRTA